MWYLNPNVMKRWVCNVFKSTLHVTRTGHLVVIIYSTFCPLQFEISTAGWLITTFDVQQRQNVWSKRSNEQATQHTWQYHYLLLLINWYLVVCTTESKMCPWFVAGIGSQDVPLIKGAHHICTVSCWPLQRRLSWNTIECNCVATICTTKIFDLEPLVLWQLNNTTNLA